MASKYLRGWSEKTVLGGRSPAGETLAGRVIISGTLLSVFFPLFFDRERLILLRVEFYTQAPFSLPWCKGPWLLYCLLFSPQLLCLPFQLFVYKFVCSHSILSVLKCTCFFWSFCTTVCSVFSFDGQLQRAISVLVTSWKLCCLSVLSNNQFGWLLFKFNLT